MKKFLKYSALLLASIIIILLIIPYFIPLDSYKDFGIKKASEITGRELKINGNITFTLFPAPSIKVKSVSLSSVPNATAAHFLEIKEVSAALSLFSLLKGEINIVAVNIYEPELNLERLPSGSASWEFFASSNKSPADYNKKLTEVNESKNLPSLYIGSIKLLKGKVNYWDTNSDRAKTNSPTTVEIDNLEIKDLHGPLNLSCQFYSSGKDYNLEGNIQEQQEVITLNANLNALKEKIIIEGDLRRDNMNYNGKFNLKGNSKNLQDFFPAIKILNNAEHDLTFNIVGDKKLLKISDINFSSGKILATGEASLALVNNEVDLKLKLNPGNMEINIKPLGGNSKGFKERISITALALKPLFNELAININDIPPTLLNKAFVFFSIASYQNENLSLNDMSLTIEKASLKGDLEFKNWPRNMQVTYNLKVNEFPTLANLLAVSLPVNLSQLGVKGEVRKEKDRIKTSNLLIFGKTAINGNIDINLKATKPEILSEIKVTSLNLNELLGNIPAANKTQDNYPAHANPASPSPWSKDKIDLSILKKIDGTINLYIQNLIKGDLIFDTIKSTISLSNGMLNVKSLTGKLYGGNLQATGQLSGDKDQAVSFKASLTGAELRNIIKQQGKIKVTKGNVNFAIDGKTSGHSQLQYINNLFGNATLKAAEGNISGFNLQKILNALKDIKRLEDILGVLDVSFSGGETKFQDLVVATDIKEGIANITHARLGAEAAEVTAKGNINLPTYSCDVEGLVSLGIKKSFPPFTVRFYGPLNNIQHQLDTKLFQQYLIKNVLGNMLKGVEEGQKPEEILKNLIGIGKDKKPTNDSDNQAPQSEEKNPVEELKSIGKEFKRLFK